MANGMGSLLARQGQQTAAPGSSFNSPVPSDDADLPAWGTVQQLKVKSDPS